MRPFLFALALAAILAVPPGVPARAAQDNAYSICPPERFEISALAVNGMEEKIVRFDRGCGALDILGADRQGKTEWEAQEIPGLPGCVADGRNHYRLFVTAQKDHAYILNTDNKLTWELDPAKTTWRQM